MLLCNKEVKAKALIYCEQFLLCIKSVRQAADWLSKVIGLNVASICYKVTLSKL